MTRTHRTRTLLTLAVLAGLAVPAFLSLQAFAEPKDDDAKLSGPEMQVEGEQPPHEFDGKRRPGAHFEKMFKDLNLTEEQKAKVKEAMGKHHTERKAWHEAHEDELKAIDDQIKALMDKKHELMKDAPKPDAAFQEIRPILNAEQQATLDAKIEKMKAKHEKGGHHWRKHGGKHDKDKGDKHEDEDGGDDDAKELNL